MAEQEQTARLAAIQARVDAASPAPWTASSRDVSGRLDSNAGSGLGWEVDGPPEPILRGQFARGEDALFLAHSRQDVPWLLQEIAGLAAERDEWARLYGYASAGRTAWQEEVDAAWEALEAALGADVCEAWTELAPAIAHLAGLRAAGGDAAGAGA